MHRHWLMWMLLMISLLTCAAWALRLGINTTPSMPYGLYRRTGEHADAQTQRGELVALCFPTARTTWEGREYAGKGGCPDGSRPLLKVLAGVPDDVVSVDVDGIRINGTPQIRSAPRDRDRHGRAMTPVLLSGRIPDGFGLMLAPTSTSFDSRYFGLVPLADLHIVRAVFIFNPIGDTP